MLARRAWVLLAAAIVLGGCAKQAVPAVEPQPARTEPDTAELRVTLELVDAAGQPLADTFVGLRGSYDTRLRAGGRSDQQGRVQLQLDELGLVFITVGEAARTLVTYGSAATRDTVVMWLEQPRELRLVHGAEGTQLALGEVWPVYAANQRVELAIEQLATQARQVDSQAQLEALVAQQWAELLAEPDARMRQLTAIHYATFAAQAIGPSIVSELLERVGASERAWAVQATYLRELLWVLGDEQRVADLIASLREHHEDAGLRAALLSHELDQLAGAGERELALEHYRELSHPRYAATIAWRSARRHDPERGLQTGHPLPPFSVSRLDASGGVLREVDLSGKAWLIQVWATWCSPCIEELDAMPALYEQLAELRPGVEFLSISVDDERSSTLETLAERELAWPSTWADDEEALMEAWGFAGVPLTLLVDEGGQVVQVWDRSPRMTALEQAVRELLSR